MDVDPLGTQIYTAAELADAIGHHLRSEFPDTIMVQGEVSDLSRSRAGHVYFNLVEPTESGHQPKASLPVALFATNKKPVNILLKRAGVGRIEDGMPLRIRTTVDFYAPRGTLSLSMSGVDPTFTLEHFESERDRLVQLVQDEGLDKPNKLRPLPASPLHIGLITSIDSAAYADFVDELELSALAWRVTAIDCRVQGQAAERGMVAALERLCANDNIELIAIIRGGGSRGDLATFDSERLARAIAHCRLPVLTGVGHEIDTSIADLVSHSSYKTPTACAVALNDRVHASLDQAEQQWQLIAANAQYQIEHAEARLAEQTTLWARDANQTVRNQHNRIDGLAASLPNTANRRLKQSDERLFGLRRSVTHQAQAITARSESLIENAHEVLGRRSTRPTELATRALASIESRVRAYDPQRTLARGWSITRTSEGELVRSADQAPPSTTIVTTVKDGDITSTVEPSR